MAQNKRIFKIVYKMSGIIVYTEFRKEEYGDAAIGTSTYVGYCP